MPVRLHADMNSTIKELAEICEKYRLAEKLLFVPSYSVGHQIGQWLAKSGAPWINLRTTTPAGFAAETVFLELAKTNIRLIESAERLTIVDDLCRRNDQWARGAGYFSEAFGVAGIVKALDNTIHELRMAGLGPDSIKPSSFLVEEKGNELIALLRAYEHRLEEKRLIDHAGLIALAARIVPWRAGQDRIVMTLSDYPVAFLEEKLIRLAGGDRLIVLGHDTPAGTVQPSAFFKTSEHDGGQAEKPETDCGLLKWILDPEAAPAPFADGTVTLFHALGESNEVREVFRRILAFRVVLDDVEIVIPSVEPYGPLIRDVAASLGVPVTFGPGVPLTMTRPGCALLTYLQWQTEDFAEKYLRYLLSDGYIRLKGAKDKPPLSARQAASFLREAQIGWGQDRYASRLASLAGAYSAKAEGWRFEGEDEKASWAEEAGKKIGWLKDWVERIIAALPRLDEATGTIERTVFYGSCLSFVEQNCRIASDLDAAAKSRIVELLQSLKSGPSLSDSLSELGTRLTEMIGVTSVGHSGPLPGALHVADYRSAGWSGRTMTFVMGLDQARFPGPVLQDPIILDEERESLGPAMKPSVEVLKEKAYLMAKLLASIRGRVTISYPCRDLLDDRELMPSSLVLNAYRVISGRPLADYTELNRYLGEPAGFAPESSSSALNEWEWWLSLYGDGGYTEASVLDCYPELARGRSAEEARTAEKMTCYDGYVPSAEGVLNPLEKKRMLSASQIEHLARCPFRFFLTYLLHVEPIEDLEKDPNQWLQGAPRGILLHDVFRQFMEYVTQRGERPDRATHWDYLKGLATESIEKWREVIPPPSAFAYEREIKEILLTSQTFLKDEEERCRTVVPCFFELSFGVKSEDGQTLYEAVEIPLGGKQSFLLRGRIDRVDRCGEHLYEVWDYKTGSAYGYKESDHYKNGRQIQHLVYSMAAEELIRRHYDSEASVVRGGYYFPGPKGEGLLIERDETRRTEGLRILKELFSLLKGGVFPSAYDSGECSFCLHAPACGGGVRAVARCKELLAGSETLLDPLRRLLGK